MNNLPPAKIIERVRGEEGELVLRRRGREFEFIFNGVFLMASYNGASEKEMVSAALNIHSQSFSAPSSRRGEETVAAGVNNGSALRVLMGGLGMGLGLQEALSFPGVAKVDLFELEEAVVRWNRGPLKGLNGGALEDPRVNVQIGDIIEYLQGEESTIECKVEPYHAIILDTDNGPGWLSRPKNEFLYGPKGTRLLKKFLLPGGCLSVWSSSPVQSYLSLLSSLFTNVQENELLEKTGQTSYYYLAMK